MEDKTRQRLERLEMEGLSADQIVSRRSERTERPDKMDAQRASRSFGFGRPLAFVVLIAVLAAFWLLNNKPAEKARKPGPVPVTLTRVETRTVPLEINTIGNVTPLSSVAIKSRVPGHLISVDFKEGEFVQKGARLFSIDPRPLQALVNEASANVLKQQALVKQTQAALAKDRAVLSQAIATKAKDAAQQRMASKEIARYEMLARQGAVSQEQADQIRSNSESLDATIKADEAFIENCRANIQADTANLESARAQLSAAQANMDSAKLQLGYTTISAPFSGRTGSLQAFIGNLVKPDENVLVTLNQMSPIYVAFAVPEHVFAEIQSYRQAGSLQVLAYAPGHEKEAVVGQLSFAENAVDAATGTIKLKAIFSNQNANLWPGEFVDVTLKLAEQANAIVVPAQAVQSGQQGTFVFTVNSNKTVALQPVKVERTINGVSVISSGLTPGQEIVLDGQMQLVPGGKIVPKAEVNSSASPR